MIGKWSGGHSSQNASAVIRSRSVASQPQSMPSASRKFRMWRPWPSSPTAEKTAVRTPRRASPVATFAANPPVYWRNVATSSSAVSDCSG